MEHIQVSHIFSGANSFQELYKFVLRPEENAVEFAKEYEQAKVELEERHRQEMLELEAQQS